MDILVPAIIAAGNKWTPKNLANLELWFTADKITGLSDGDAVASWPDSSGNSRDATQATSGRRPIYKTSTLNGKPVVRFTAANAHRLVSAFSDIAQPTTLFIVYSISANTGTYQRIIDGTVSGKRQNLYWYNNKIGENAGSSLEYNKTIPFSHLILSVLCNGASSQIWGNGTSQVSGNAGTQVLNGMSIGSYYDGSVQHFNGDIAEIVYYSSALSTTDRQKVEKYLSDKYGIAVAA